MLVLLIYAVSRFNAGANPAPIAHHAQHLVEVVWTVVPMLILIVIAIPSFRLLYFQRDIPKADMTMKIIGNQWNWTYDYPDNGAHQLHGLSQAKGRKLQEGEPYLLTTDVPVVVPVEQDREDHRDGRATSSMPGRSRPSA